MAEPDYAYRLPPCPACDVEGMESWLGEMAEQGLLLSGDGFFAGVAIFQRTCPRPARYRLEAAQKDTSMWSEDGGEPDPEQVALGRAYAWEYVARWGDFYIYRTFDPHARELNTDPRVQALALEAVKKRRASKALELVCWTVVYSLLMLRDGALLTVINMGTGLAVLTAAFLLWMLEDAVRAQVQLGRLQKRLRAGEALTRRKDWRRHGSLYHGKKAAQIIFALVLAGIFLHNWSVDVMNEDRIPLERYTGRLPFADMAELAGGEVSDYQTTMTGLRFNYVEEKSDWLAPRCVHYVEHARLTLADGRVLDGGLYVDCFEMRSGWLARRLAREYERQDARERPVQPLALPELGADFARGYKNEVHFPTLLLQDGRTVLRASFYQISRYALDFQDWARAMYESVDLH